jgi:hypothetical protein
MVKKPLLSQPEDEGPEAGFYHGVSRLRVEQWRDMMFSEESHFVLHLGDKHGRCRLPVGLDRFDPKHPAKVMVWGCFSWQGRGGLEFLKKGEKMNTQRGA